MKRVRLFMLAELCIIGISLIAGAMIGIGEYPKQQIYNDNRCWETFIYMTHSAIICLNGSMLILVLASCAVILVIKGVSNE